MIKKYTLFLAAAIMLLLAACGNQANTPAPEDDLPENTAQENTAPTENEPGGAESEDSSMSETGTNALGAMTPEDALEYMKTTPDLVIVEVNTDYWKLKTGFTGAMHIPHDEMSERYDEIPSGVPVILHCGAGVVSVPAYETLLEKRPDIPELSYIAGAPPVASYNEWLAAQK